MVVLKKDQPTNWPIDKHYSMRQTRSSSGGQLATQLMQPPNIETGQSKRKSKSKNKNKSKKKNKKNGSEKKHVTFNTEVLVHPLPSSEAEDAWATRFGPWRSAPIHDEYWDGDHGNWRVRELTEKELKELMLQLKVRKVLPGSVYNVFRRYRKRHSITARTLESVVALQPDNDPANAPIDLRKPAVMPTAEELEKLDNYFERLEMMDRPPSKNRYDSFSTDGEDSKDTGTEDVVKEETSVEDVNAITTPVEESLSPDRIGLTRGDSTNNSSSQNFLGSSKSGDLRKTARKATHLDQNRVTRGDSMLTPSDWEPNNDGMKVERFLSRLAQLDGLSHTSVNRNRKTREVLKKYRDGNYSFSLLEKDLDVV